MPKPVLVVILGPTASGKTRLAAELAVKAPGEVISADSRQVYRGLNIGTGKDLAEYAVAEQRVPVHMIDIVDPGYEFNVFEFQSRCFELIPQIRARGHHPILCGGSGMYLDAVLKQYRLVDTPRNDALRAKLESCTTDDLAVRLARLRPLHNKTDSTDRDRMVRAIEIEETARAEPAEPIPTLDADVYGLHWQRERLRQRITRRLQQRLDSGLVEEVKSLMDDGLPAGQLDFYGLEYRYVMRYVCGEINRNDMFQKLNSAIYQFAKRQETWFRRMQRQGVEISWLDGEAAADKNVAVITKRLMERAICADEP